MFQIKRSARPWPMAFAAGFVAVLVFHQGILALLYGIHFEPHAPFPQQPTVPLGVPAIWSLAFWGGVWGLVLNTFERWFPRYGPAYLVSALIFGAVGPTLFAWFVVFPLKGIPIAGGFSETALITGVSVNAAWGLGTGLCILSTAHLSAG